jgi:hypothetical protein
MTTAPRCRNAGAVKGGVELVEDVHAKVKAALRAALQKSTLNLGLRFVATPIRHSRIYRRLLQQNVVAFEGRAFAPGELG